MTFEGRYEHVTGAGLAPLPVQRPIPIWFGGASAPRATAGPDGSPTVGSRMVPPGPRLDEAQARSSTRPPREAGRDPSAIGMEGRVPWTREGGLDIVLDHVERWRRTGASHLEINTMRAGFASVDDHLAALSNVAEAIGLQPHA